MVGAMVVRVFAFAAGDAANRFATDLPNSQRFASAIFCVKGSSSARKLIMNSTNSRSCGKGLFSRVAIARANAPIEVTRLGAEACPPTVSARKTRERYPFSATPTKPTGASMPGTEPCEITPPSSIRKERCTPRSFRVFTIWAAPRAPETSSSSPKAR